MADPEDAITRSVAAAIDQHPAGGGPTLRKIGYPAADVIWPASRMSSD